MRSTPGWAALRIAGIFFLVSVVYIAFSDQALLLLVGDPLIVSRVQTIKGWAYVTAAAILIYSLLRPEFEARERHHRELQSLNRNLRVLSEFNQFLVRCRDEQALMDEACRILFKFGEYPLAWVGVPESDAERTIRPVARFGVQTEYLDQLKVSWGNNEHSHGPTGIAIRERRPVLFENLQRKNGNLLWEKNVLSQDFASIMALPLVSEDELYGVLAIYSRSPEAFPATEQRLMEELAGDLAYGIHTLRASQDQTRTRQALEASEARFRDLAESIQDMFFALDTSLRVTYWNNICIDWTGLRPSQVLGRSLLEIYAGNPKIEEISQHYRRAMETQTPQQFVTEFFGMQGHNTHDISVYPSQEGVTVISRNITAQRQAQLVAQRRLGELETLYAASRRLLNLRSQEEITQITTDALRSILSYEFSGVLLLEENGTVLKPYALRVNRQGGEEVLRHILGERIYIGQGQISQAIIRRRSINIGALSEDEELVKHLPTIESLLVVPLLGNTELIGVIAVADGRKQLFDDNDVRLLETLASLVASALQNARLFYSLDSQRALLRSLTAQLTQAEEREKARLARELHDEVGQTLTALSVNLNLIRSLLPGETPQFVVTRLEDAQNLVIQTGNHIRHVMSDLRPPVLEDYGLFAGLRWYADQVSQRSGLQIELEGAPVEPRLNTEQEITLYRITQEALTNIIKHAQAKRVVLRLEKLEQTVFLSITDDGVGFDPTNLPQRSETSGWGLSLMRERIEQIGGRFALHTQPGGGARLSLELDCEPA